MPSIKFAIFSEGCQNSENQYSECSKPRKSTQRPLETVQVELQVRFIELEVELELFQAVVVLIFAVLSIRCFDVRGFDFRCFDTPPFYLNTL